MRSAGTAGSNQQLLARLARLPRHQGHRGRFAACVDKPSRDRQLALAVCHRIRPDLSEVVTRASSHRCPGRLRQDSAADGHAAGKPRQGSAGDPGTRISRRRFIRSAIPLCQGGREKIGRSRTPMDLRRDKSRRARNNYHYRTPVPRASLPRVIFAVKIAISRDKTPSLKIECRGFPVRNRDLD